MRKQDLIKAFKGIASDEAALDVFNTLNKQKGIVQNNEQKARIEAGSIMREQYAWDERALEYVLYEFKGE